MLKLKVNDYEVVRIGPEIYVKVIFDHTPHGTRVSYGIHAPDDDRFRVSRVKAESIEEAIEKYGRPGNSQSP